MSNRIDLTTGCCDPRMLTNGAIRPGMHNGGRKGLPIALDFPCRRAIFKKKEDMEGPIIEAREERITALPCCTKEAHNGNRK
jgi:hypothetical protein